ncbi:MAG TPA: MFS transporter, partial [Phycisphaerae bacterium]|nr:MFS transporter [Phycisphaerae bacterium]
MRRSSLLTIFLIVFIDLVGFGIVLPNLQLYGQQYGIDNYFFLVLIGASYSFFQFLFAPVLGRWSDQIGRRPVLLISQCGTLAGFLMLFSANFFHGIWGIAVIFASRILNGITGANISTANAYIADITTPENRAKGMGAIGAAFGMGFVLGPVIGGTVSHFAGLQYVPLVAAVFTIAALSMTWFTLAESRTPNAASNDAAARRFSFRGLEHALKRPIIGPLILLFFVNGFAFAGMEQTLSLLIQNRIYPIPSLIAGIKNPTVDSTSTINDQRRIQDDKASTASGYLFGCIGIMIVLVQGGMIGRLSRRFGELKLVVTGPVITAVGLIVIGLPIHWPWVWTGFLLGGLLLAIGNGIFNPSMQSLISRHASANEQGEILGANQGMASLARAIGPLLAGL